MSATVFKIATIAAFLLAGLMVIGSKEVADKKRYTWFAGVSGVLYVLIEAVTRLLP